MNFSLGGNVNIGTYAFSSPGVKSRVDKIKVEDEKKTKLGGGGGGVFWGGGGGGGGGGALLNLRRM